MAASIRLKAIAAAALALSLVGAVIAVARSRGGPPARCAPGMIAVGPRCCGDGQHLDGDRCAGRPIRCAPGLEARDAGCIAVPRIVRIEGGLLRVGPGDWEAQGVVSPYETSLAPFGLDAFEVTEDRWSACVAAGACPSLALTGEPGRAASGMSMDEAARFCRWSGGALPTRDQLAFAAAGKLGRRYAWGDTGAVCRRAAWGLAAGPCGWGARGPEIAGSHPDGASPEGARDLAGNVAEWATGDEGPEVRGGSYADGAASALRSWQRRVVPPGHPVDRPRPSLRLPVKHGFDAMLLHVRDAFSATFSGPMTVALLSIGTELTRGEIVNTNASWIAAELTAAGFNIVAMETAPDDLDVVANAVRRLAAAHRLVIATGGLGPTTDDLTAAAAARAAGVELVRDESALLAIRRRVEARGKTMNPGLEKQADVPAGSDILPNANGTAPGFSVQIGETAALFLPGVPREMKRMFTEQVLPRVRPTAPNTGFQIRLRTYGMGESSIGQALEGIESAHAGVTLGYRVNFPEVDVKVHARAASQSLARDLALAATSEVKARIGRALYGEGDETFAEIVGRAVRSRGWRLALAESCTGGIIAHLLTSHPASDYLVGGAVTHANSAKSRLLGVSEDTLRGHGAVSAEVAAAMAEGARRLCECDVGLGVTGVIGPNGGTTDKPAGLVFWAVAHPGGTVVRDHVFIGDRDEVQLAAAYAGLDLLRRVAAGLPER